MSSIDKIETRPGRNGRGLGRRGGAALMDLLRPGHMHRDRDADDRVADPRDVLASHEIDFELADQSIGAALDGYAKDGGTWLQAKGEFYSELAQWNGANRWAMCDRALRAALDSAADGAESDPREATQRFWDTMGDIERDSYGDMVSEMSSMMEGVLASSQPNADSNDTSNERYMPTVGSVFRSNTDEHGVVSYEISTNPNAQEHGFGNFYKWTQGDEVVHCEEKTSGNPAGTTRQLTEGEVATKLAVWQLAADLAVVDKSRKNRK